MLVAATNSWHLRELLFVTAFLLGSSYFGVVHGCEYLYLAFGFQHFFNLFICDSIALLLSLPFAFAFAFAFTPFYLMIWFAIHLNTDPPSLIFTLFLACF